MLRFSFLSFALVLGCGEAEPESPDTCETKRPGAECTPLYAPTFDNIYRETMSTRCAVGGGSCHLAAERAGALALDTPDEAYTGLLSMIELDPDGSSECGDLLSRLVMTDAPGAMPPGQPLSEGEICAMSIWLDRGAPR